MRTTEAAVRRDTGIELAVDKANRDEEGWSDAAFFAVQRFCMSGFTGKRFLAEDVRAWAESGNIVSRPINERAWGAVMRRAAANGLIKKVGYAPAKSSNLSPKCQWEVL